MDKNNILIKAVNKNVRTSPRKLALVCNFIKGKKEEIPLRDLEFTRKKIAKDVRKTVNSAISNEENKWRKSKIGFLNDNTLKVSINEKFIGERGRINCSLRDPSGYWRWLGIQFVISDR